MDSTAQVKLPKVANGRSRGSSSPATMTLHSGLPHDASNHGIGEEGDRDCTAPGSVLATTNVGGHSTAYAAALLLQPLPRDAPPIDLWPSVTRQNISATVIKSDKHNPLTGRVQPKAKLHMDVLDLTTPEPHLLSLLNRRIAHGMQELEQARIFSTAEEAVLKAKVHRDAFEVLINEFRSYRPLLCRIMAAYDNALEVQAEEIRSLKPLKHAATTYKAEFEQRWLEKKSIEDQTIQILRRQIKDLKHEIYRLHEREKDWQAQLDKLSMEAGKSYKRYREEADQRSMLITELNEIHYKEQDMAKAAQAKGKPRDDPAVLNILINRLKTDLAEAQRKLVETIADYGDVVPRKEFDKVSKAKKKLSKELKSLQDSHNALKAKHSALQTKCDATLVQRDTICSELVEVQRSCTPRPDWNAFEEDLVPEDGDWSEIRDIRTSKQMAEAVHAHLRNEPLPELVDGKYGPQVLKGRGTAPAVPPHLRAEGVIRNRHIRQKEALGLIQEVWSTRQPPREDEKIAKRTNLSDHLMNLLEKRYVIPSLCSEWAYSLDDACRRYAPQDAHIALFHAIINKQVDESAYHTQQKMLTSLKDTLMAATLPTEEADEEKTEPDADQEAGVMSGSSLADNLRKVFPFKSEVSIDELCDCAVEEASVKASSELSTGAAPTGSVEQVDTAADEEQAAAPGESTAEKSDEEADGESKVMIKKLFEVGETGYASEFVHVLREQERQEKLDYLSDINAALELDAESDEVNVDQLRSAIQKADPEKSEKDVTQILAYAYATSTAAVQPGKTAAAQLPSIMERLQARGLQRSGPRPQAAMT
eukprot:scpid24761/ scgid24560/ Translin-associated factor X-interacting protein 1